MTTSSIAQALPPLRTDTADLQAQHVAPNPNAQYSPPSAPASSASDSDYLHVKRPAKQDWQHAHGSRETRQEGTRRLNRGSL